MIQAATPALVLASASASRRALLDAAGLRYQALAASVEEASLKEAAQTEGLSAADAAVLLADAKARHIARRMPEALVIGSDQLMVCEGRWFDKPADMAQAEAHLRALSGRTHQLVNGTVAWRGGRRIWQNAAVATLTVRSVSAGGNLLMVVGLQMWVGSGVLLVVAWLTEPLVVRMTPELIAAFVYQLLVPGLFATLLWFTLVKRVGAVRASTFHFLNPFFGVVVAAVLLGEHVSGTDIAGVLIAMAGILAVQWARVVLPVRQPPSP